MRSLPTRFDGAERMKGEREGEREKQEGREGNFMKAAMKSR